MRLAGVTTIVLLAMAAVRILFAQGVPATVTFEVVSIRPVAGSSGLSPLPRVAESILRITASGGLVGRAKLRDIVRLAYGTEPYERVAAEPSSSGLLEEQFEIRALPSQAAFAPNREDVMAMTRNMLAERFGMKVRIDSELGSATVLRIIKPGVLGSGLRPAPEGCRPLPADANPYDAGFADAYLRSCVLTFFNDRLRGTVTLEDFARMVSLFARRPILDQTGLRGMFTIDVSVAGASVLPNGPTRVGSALLGTEQSDAPAFVDALRDQMGLSARRERQPIRLFVVEHAGPLIEN